MVSTRPAVPPIYSQAILLLSLAAFASAVSMRMTDALLPQLSTEFGISLGNAALVITVFSVAYGISQLLFGPLGDRHGKYRVVSWVCGASAVTASACGLAPDFDWLVVARLFAGVTAAAIIPLSMAWIGDVVPYEQRQPVIARFLIGQILGISSGVLLGGLAADVLGRHLPFFGLGALYLVIGLSLSALNRRLPDEARATTRSVDGSVVRHTLDGFLDVLSRPWARVVLLTVFLEGVFLYGPFAFIASHLHLRFGLSLATAGLLVMLFGAGGLVFATFAQWLVRRLGETGMTACGIVLLAVSFLALALAPSWWWAIPCCTIAGLGFYMFHNTLQTNATQMAPERRGAAVATFASLFFLGQSAGVWASGFLATRFGPSAALCAGAAGLLVIGLNFSRLRRARTPVAQPVA